MIRTLKIGDRFKPVKGMIIYSEIFNLLDTVRDLSDEILVVEELDSCNNGKGVVICFCSGRSASRFQFFEDEILEKCELIPDVEDVSYQDRLINFMAKMAELIAYKTKGKIRDYFTEDDKSDILNWSDDDAEKVVDRLDFSEEDDEKVCPFCIYIDVVSKRCNECSYGKNHGVCHESGSLYNMMVKDLPDGESILNMFSEKEIDDLNSILGKE